jgi:RNA polymerase sigma-70 factor (ECF subfamily)
VISFNRQKEDIMNRFFGSSNRRVSREEQIYDECHKKLYYTSLRILSNSMEAEEVMHDTLLKYFSREEFDNQRERDSWLTRVCINMSIDRLRKRRTEENHLKSDELKGDFDESDRYEDYSFRGITVNMVKEALMALAEGYRVILSLVLFEGYDYEEVAQIIGVKEVSVRTQYIRGKARLIEELEKRRG